MDWHLVTQCSGCGSNTSLPYFRSYVPSWYDDRPLELVMCDQCRLVRTKSRPLPEDLYKNYLAGNSVAKNITKKKLERKNIFSHHLKVLKDAKSYCKTEPSALFDIGCGAGTLVQTASREGLHAEGNDVNKYSVKSLQDSGYNVHLGFTHELDTRRDFDIVTCLDYLEHSFQPLDDLSFAYSILNPGGVFYLKTLYLGCPDHDRDGNAWSLFGCGHFHYFFSETLVELIEKVGFQIESVVNAKLVTVVARK